MSRARKRITSQRCLVLRGRALNQSPSPQRQHLVAPDHHYLQACHPNPSHQDHRPLTKATREHLHPIFQPDQRLVRLSRQSEAADCLVVPMTDMVGSSNRLKPDLVQGTSHRQVIAAAVELLLVLEAVALTAMSVPLSALLSVLDLMVAVVVMMGGPGLEGMPFRSIRDLIQSPVIAMNPAVAQLSLCIPIGWVTPLRLQRDPNITTLRRVLLREHRCPRRHRRRVLLTASTLSVWRSSTTTTLKAHEAAEMLRKTSAERENRDLNQLLRRLLHRALTADRVGEVRLISLAMLHHDLNISMTSHLLVQSEAADSTAAKWVRRKRSRITDVSTPKIRHLGLGSLMVRVAVGATLQHLR